MRGQERQEFNPHEKISPAEERPGFPESFSRHTWNEGKKMFEFLEAACAG